MSYTVFWLLWLVVALIVEGSALLRPESKGTLSEHVWRWLAVGAKNPTWLHWTLRVALLVFLVWLIPHFQFGWFTPSDPVPW